MNSVFDEFAKLVGKRYGNPNAVFVSGRLNGQRKVRVITYEANGDGRVIGATTTGKRDRRGHHIVIATDGVGRKYRLAVPRRNVLIKW